MKTLLFFIIIIIFSSCSFSSDHATTKSSSNQTSTSLEKNQITEKPKEFSIPYQNNPALYGGSPNGFMGYIQALYKTGQYSEIIRYTSSSTISKFGKQKLLNYFSKMDFGYNMKLKSQSKINDSVYVMNYEADIMATKVMKRFMVVVERDSCKWVVEELK